VFGRLVTFAFGVGFFGQPLLIKAGKWLITHLPENWEELVDIRKCVECRNMSDEC
jgi:hypothetical protein